MPILAEKFILMRMRCKDIPIFVLRFSEIGCVSAKISLENNLRMTMKESIKTKNICILSQTGYSEILVRVGLATRTTD